MDQNTDWARQYFTEEQMQRMQELSERAYTPEARAKLAARGGL